MSALTGFACLSLVMLSGCAPAVRTATGDVHMDRALRALALTPVIDGHNDLAWEIRASARPHDVEAYDLRRRTPGHTDLERLRAGRVGGQFWSVYTPGEYRDSGYARVQLEQIDIARRFIARHPERLQWALTASAMRDALRSGRIGSLLGLEGGHAIENSLGALRAYYDLGVRYMTLTHSVTLDWVDAATGEQRHGGLTEFGKEVVREMNRLGMLVDLSHVSPGTMSDALDVSEAPVIFSHSSARALVDVPRNVPDSILRRLPANGGVVMVTFVTGFVSRDVAAYAGAENAAERAARAQPGATTASVAAAMGEWRRSRPRPKATIAHVADHIDHIRRVAGVDHVGIGGDFDGISFVVEGLEDVSSYPRLFAELSRRGWSEAELRKLSGENILRVMARAEQVSARIRQNRAPSVRTISELDGVRTTR